MLAKKILTILSWLYMSSLCLGVTIVLDPGHGGPGGGMYGTNGDGNGAEGLGGLTEEWVNLRVGLLTRDSLNTWPLTEVIMTRILDTNFVPIPRRAQYARNSNATYFLSIHHNGLESGSDQGSEVLWTSKMYDDSLYLRSVASRDSGFAKKVLLRLVGEWGYVNRCGTRCQPNWMHGCDDAYQENSYLLRNSHLAYTALSEASDISYHTWEEGLFANLNSGHAEQEASALYHAIHSHYYNMGYARISNRYLGGNSQELAIDGIALESPVELTWEVGEQHYIYAPSDFYDSTGFYHFTFHHWAHLSPDEYPNPWAAIEWYFHREWFVSVVNEEPYHIFRAYFTGGPYFCNLYDPNWGGLYGIGDTLWIGYSCSIGVDSSSLVDVYLDRHNGQDGFSEMIAQNVPYANGVRWIINGPPSTDCLMKVIARDVAGNADSAISRFPFAIDVCGWLVGDANGDGARDISDAVYLIARIFSGGLPPTPHPTGSGDFNCDQTVDISDAVAIVSYIFAGGAAPSCDCTSYTRRTIGEPFAQQIEEDDNDR